MLFHCVHSRIIGTARFLVFAFNLVVEGRLSAVTADIGTLNADKANIEDLTTGTLTVHESINAQNLDVNGTITVNQIKDSQGNLPSGTLKWQTISVAKGLTQSDKTYIWQRNSDNKIEYAKNKEFDFIFDDSGLDMVNAAFVRKIFVESFHYDDGGYIVCVTARLFDDDEDSEGFIFTRFNSGNEEKDIEDAENYLADLMKNLNEGKNNEISF